MEPRPRLAITMKDTSWRTAQASTPFQMASACSATTSHGTPFSAALRLMAAGRGLADDRSHADEFAAELLRQIDGRINRLVTQIRPVCSYQYLNASHADLLIESNTFVLKRLVTHQIIVPASSSRLTCIPALS